MAMILDEKNFIDENIFKYENRLNSPVSRFIDKSQTYVTYFHINADESTVDGGFKDVEDLIGDRSPLKFQKIENLPLYMSDAVMLALNEGDEGLNTGYEGEAVVLPNTVRPYPNDYFMIPYLRDSFIFRVTGVEYDNIRPDGYFKLQFKLEYIDDDKVHSLYEQVKENFTCILQNVGTENNCILQEDYYKRLMEVDALYQDIANTYLAIFYSERHNCFLGEKDGMKLFDPLQSQFINKHNLFNKKENLKTIHLSEGFSDGKRRLLYEKSIYRFFERRDSTLAKEFSYYTYSAMGKVDSTFHRWHDDTVYIVDPTENGNHVLIPLEIANIFRLNGVAPTDYIDLMRAFIRNEELTIYDIPLTLNEGLMSLDGNAEFFFFTPILMYIIQTVVNEFLAVK